MATNTLEKYETTQITQKINRGEIWWANLPKVGGSINEGSHPFLILQNDVGNRFSPSVWGVSLTSRDKKQLPTHTHVLTDEGLDKNSTVLGEQPISIPVTSLVSKICKVSEKTLQRIEYAHFFSGGFLERYHITLKTK